MTTTPYYVKVAPRAARQMEDLSLKQRKVIFKFIDSLAINPRPPGARKIEGMTGLYCDSMNHLRLIYKIDEQEVLLLLVLGRDR